MTGRALLLPGFGLASLLLAAAAAWMTAGLSRQARVAARIASVQPEADQAGAPPGEDAVVRAVAGLGDLLHRSGLLPDATLAGLEATLASAGMRPTQALALFIGAKVVLLALCPLLAWAALQALSLHGRLVPLAVGAAAVAGLLAPDRAVRSRRSRYLKAVGRGLPDALDMLVICSEAGLGLEAGLERVAAEIEPAHPAVAAELRTTSTELRVLADRRAALTNMGARTGLDTLKRLGGTLVQTLQYGTPLSQALRTLSSEMRYEMLIRFEAQAARLPVLLTLPMILFILPCIFIVVGGPAGLTVMRTLLHR